MARSSASSWRAGSATPGHIRASLEQVEPDLTARPSQDQNQARQQGQGQGRVAPSNAGSYSMWPELKPASERAKIRPAEEFFSKSSLTAYSRASSVYWTADVSFDRRLREPSPSAIFGTFLRLSEPSYPPAPRFSYEHQDLYQSALKVLSDHHWTLADSSLVVLYPRHESCAQMQVASIFFSYDETRVRNLI